MAEEVKDTQKQTELKQSEQPENTPKTYSEQEYNALKTQLESLKQSAKESEDFKKKWEQSEKERKDFEHKTKVASYVRSLGLKDDVYEKYVTDEIIKADFQFDGDKLIGGDEFVSKFKETHTDAFKASAPEKFVAPTGNNTETMSGVEQAFYSINPDLKK